MAVGKIAGSIARNAVANLKQPAKVLGQIVHGALKLPVIAFYGIRNGLAKLAGR